MPATPIKNTRNLRDFLLEVMEQVRDGTIDAAKATAIGKLAAHVNESLKTEAQLRLDLLRLRAGNPEIATEVDKEIDALEPDLPRIQPVQRLAAGGKL